MTDDESLESLLTTVEMLARDIRELKAALREVRRYLRDEGYGEADDEGPESLDDD